MIFSCCENFSGGTFSFFGFQIKREGCCYCILLNRVLVMFNLHHSLYVLLDCDFKCQERLKNNQFVLVRVIMSLCVFVPMLSFTDLNAS